MTLTPQEWSVLVSMARGYRLHRGDGGYTLRRAGRPRQSVPNGTVGRLLFGGIITPQARTAFTLTPAGVQLSNVRP